ncbi:homeobox protein 5 [Drosophila innubila]|uniref:homeobox protein 5 n=1 Tax=Drosophila innubila TaxID=198719 RepID=UPI00148DF031|nr:homeobox protein 5 [Drosophila innubila]XP_034490897.1 homeobox protein 5 [Drosophila innubila]XP_034490899.1 homeobox protein 5 [Drosophila innubila]
MEKTPRYTQRERNMVLTYAAQHKDVIENKRTDAESNRKKDEVWLQIAKDFNSKVYHQRSAKQLRQLYKNMKLLLKKDLCGEDKGNRSFLDLLNTLSQQESVAQYIAEQMSPDGAGSQTAANGRHLTDDYEDSKLPMYEGMDTDVILIKSETISDNEQTENGMDCMDDDDDDDCQSPKVPEVCLEEEDEVLFPTDRNHLQQHSGGGSLPSVNSSNLAIGGNGNDPMPRATSSPVCSTKTSISSTGSYMSGGVPKAEITLSAVGNIRVGSFANISNTLLNGNSNNINNNNNNSSSKNNNNNINNNNSSSNINNSNSSMDGARSLQLTAEQVQQHLLLNGLGLSAVHHPPAQSLQAAINAATSGVGSSRQTQTLQLPRLQRGHNAAATAAAATAAAAVAAAAAGGGATNGSSGNANGGNTGAVQLLLNGHQSRDKTHAQQLHPGAGITLAAGSFNGYNGLGVSNISSINCSASNNNNHNNHNNSTCSNNSANNSSNSMNISNVNAHGNSNNTNNANNNNNSGSSSNSSGSRGQHNEYMMTLAVEERKRKIELLNVQIEYWQTLTKKLDSQSGHYPNPACLCHFPGSNVLGVGGVGVGVGVGSVGVAAGGNTAATNALQTQSSSS